MAFIVGIALALRVCGAAAWLGMVRDRVFCPAVLIVIASYQVLFAVMDGRHELLFSTMAHSAAFMGFAVAGFKRDLWLAVGALAGDGGSDFFHHALVPNTGVPRGWPGFRLTFDLTAAAIVGCVLAFRTHDKGHRPNLGSH